MHLLVHTEPSSYPPDLMITAKTSSFITFQWSKLKCHQENGPITGYQYRVYRDLFQYTEGTIDQSTTTYTVFDTTMLSFSVAAMNEAGIGEHCPPLQIPMSDQSLMYNRGMI